MATKFVARKVSEIRLVGEKRLHARRAPRAVARNGPVAAEKVPSPLSAVKAAY